MTDSEFKAFLNESLQKVKWQMVKQKPSENPKKRGKYRERSTAG